jgi:hypothetical protein
MSRVFPCRLSRINSTTSSKVSFGSYDGDRVAQSPFKSVLSRVRRVREVFKLIDQFRERSFLRRLLPLTRAQSLLECERDKDALGVQSGLGIAREYGCAIWMKICRHVPKLRSLFFSKVNLSGVASKIPKNLA